MVQSGVPVVVPDDHVADWKLMLSIGKQYTSTPCEKSKCHHYGNLHSPYTGVLCTLGQYLDASYTAYLSFWTQSSHVCNTSYVKQISYFHVRQKSQCHHELVPQRNLFRIDVPWLSVTYIAPQLSSPRKQPALGHFLQWLVTHWTELWRTPCF